MKVLGGKEREFATRFEEFYCKSVQGSLLGSELESFKSFISNQKMCFEGFRLNTANNFDFVPVNLQRFRRLENFTSVAEVERFVGKAKYQKLNESFEPDD